MILVEMNLSQHSLTTDLMQLIHGKIDTSKIWFSVLYKVGECNSLLQDFDGGDFNCGLFFITILDES